MSTPRYLLAKYVPDLLRYEPRNIGVIVWTPEVVLARFLGERPGHEGDLDGRSIPSFLANPSVYKQWVEYWRASIASEQIKILGSSALVPRASSEFLDALVRTGRGEFLLTDGGFLLDGVPLGEVPQLLNHLFSTLVDTPAVEDSRDLRLDQICTNLLQEVKLFDHPNFIPNYELECPIVTAPARALFETFKFSYAYKNGIIKGLYHQVPLSKKRPTLKRVIHDSAWMFEKVIVAELITYEKTAALVHASPERLTDREVRNSLDVLSSVTRVINVAQPEEAKEEFKKLAEAA